VERLVDNSSQRAWDEAIVTSLKIKPRNFSEEFRKVMK
jgi:hypothetical protein